MNPEQRKLLQQKIRQLEVESDQSSNLDNESKSKYEIVSDKFTNLLDELTTYVYKAKQPGAKDDFGYELPCNELLEAANSEDFEEGGELDMANYNIKEYLEFLLSQEDPELVVKAFSIHLGILRDDKVNQKVHYKMYLDRLSSCFEKFAKYFIYSFKNNISDRYDYSNLEPFQIYSKFRGIDAILKDENGNFEYKVKADKVKLVSYYLELEKEVKELSTIYLIYLTASQYYLYNPQVLLNRIDAIISRLPDQKDRLENFKRRFKELSEGNKNHDAKLLVELMTQNDIKPSSESIQEARLKTNKDELEKQFHPDPHQLGIEKYIPNALTESDFKVLERAKKYYVTDDILLDTSIYSILKQIIYLQVKSGTAFKENLLSLYRRLDADFSISSLME